MPHVEEVYFLLKGITKPSSKVAVSTLHVYQQQMRVLVALHLQNFVLSVFQILVVLVDT